jgi:hypothetical protein
LAACRQAGYCAISLVVFIADRFIGSGRLDRCRYFKTVEEGDQIAIREDGVVIIN